MRKFSSMLLLLFLFQFSISEKTIKITGINSATCDINTSQQFSVYFLATYTDISGNDQIYLPLKTPTGFQFSCTLNPTSSLLPCSLNAILNPIYNEKVTVDTSITKVSGITIQWSLTNPTIFEGKCSKDFTHKFTVENHTEVIKCQDKYNLVDIFGNYESLTNNDLISILSEGTQITFPIDIGGDVGNSICYLYESEGKMSCMIEGKGKAVFHQTTGEGSSETPVVLMVQSFEMQLRDCSSNSESKFIKLSLLGLLLLILL